MDLVAGAMGNLASKLLELLGDEYNLQQGVKDQVRHLAKELNATNVSLSKVAKVPYDQLDPQVKLWASEAREASYDMEDILDTFLVRVDNCHQPTNANKGIVHRLVENISMMVNKFKARRNVTVAIESIMKEVNEIAMRRNRYNVDAVLAKSATVTSIDPRILMTIRTKASELVDMDEPSDALIKALTFQEAAPVPHLKRRKLNMLNMSADNASSRHMRLVSIVGSGGLGKTTLAKVVYEKLLKVDTEIACKAFVPVGRNPDLRKVLRDILLDLDKEKYMNAANLKMLDQWQLIKEIQDFLKEKRYFIVIDDVWDVASWEVIRTAFQENNMGSKIMITTRHIEVAKLVHCTYEIQPLCPDSSKILFYGRVFGSQDSCPENISDLSANILKKCAGVPLAIITIASLLANKSKDITEWQEVFSSIGSGLGTGNDMRKILSLSYYDLPPHMKTCFLYLSMYPEDYVIDRDGLIWRWIAEGFIQPKTNGDDLFEIGNSYFNDLINRSLIQPVGNGDHISDCRVHDMILDLICSLSREENFVTTSDDFEKEMSLESKKLRRLSLKYSGVLPKKGAAQDRSIAVFGFSMNSILSVSRLEMLRVLDLENNGSSLNNCRGSELLLGNLVHLRYLRLVGTGLKVLPRDLEKLQFLQVLNAGIELPESIFRLRQLMCLEGVHWFPQQGNLLSNLMSLQVLSTLVLVKDPASTLEALGQLTQLKKLGLNIKLKMVDRSICETFIDTLGKLLRLQSLRITGSTTLTLVNWERWAPPRHLHKLYVSGTMSRTLPKWISSASINHLTELNIIVCIVRPEDIQILGTLPNLVQLGITADHENYLEQPQQKFTVRADSFPCLITCTLNWIVIVPCMFTRGAMPRVTYFSFHLRARDFFPNPGGFDFDDLAIDHLPLLEIFQCLIIKGEIDKEEAEKLQVAVKFAADVHPNHPKLYGSILSSFAQKVYPRKTQIRET